MKVKNHGSALRFVVLISNSLLCFGLFFLYDSMVSLQTILMGVSCVGLNTSTPLSQDCCESCLGFNALEYNILVGLPQVISTVGSLCAGFVVDRYGYCLFSFILTLFAVVGAVVRAMATAPGLSHAASYGLMLTGSMIVDNAFPILYIIQLYVCARWFSGKYVSFAVGVTMAINVSGTVLAFYVNPVLVESIGLENTMWCAVIIGGSVVPAAVLLWVLEGLAGGKGNQTEPSALPFATLKQLNCRFWLVSCIISTSWLVFTAFMSNSTAYQTDLYKLPYKTASFYSGVTYITKIVFSPIAGGIASTFDIHGPVAVVGCLFYLSSLVMLTMAAGPPIVIIILMGLGFAFVYTVMAAVLTELVPFDKLATANGIMSSMLCFAMGMGDIVVGVIVQSQSDRIHGWLLSGVFLFAVAIVVFVLVLVLFVADARSSNRVMCWGRRGYKRIDDESESGEKQELHENGATKFGALDSTSQRHRLGGT